MYTQLRNNLPATRRTAAARRPRLPRVSRVVLFLGLTSLFTDISSEMVSSVLPYYAVYSLALSPFAFGLLDGLYQGVSALMRLTGGLAADRSGRHKTVAVTGYGLSALCRVGLLVAGSAWAGLASVIVVDRAGKGIRTAPRDAMISLNTPPEQLGAAFGVHRALDTLGALLGPVLAFLILSSAPDAYDAVFMVSLCAAVVGLGFLVLFVEPPAEAGALPARPRLTPRLALRMLRLPGIPPLAAAGALLTAVTISDGFLFIYLQQQLNLRYGVFPLLFVATSAVYFLLAVPAGMLADRVSRRAVYLGGYALLLPTYALLLLTQGSGTAAIIVIVLIGAYYAATDGVLMALASALLPGETRSTGLGAITTVTSLMQMCSSFAVGALWVWQGPETAITVMLGGMALALLAAALLLRKVGTAPPVRFAEAEGQRDEG